MPLGYQRHLEFFSQLMSIVWRGMGGFALAYLDDILVFSKDPEEHFRHSQLVFDRLKQDGLKLIPQK